MLLNNSRQNIYKYIYTHTHTYIYIYIYIFVRDYKYIFEFVNYSDLVKYFLKHIWHETFFNKLGNIFEFEFYIQILYSIKD